MNAVRYIISFLVLLVLYDASFAFDDIIEGKEYNFKYHLSGRSYVKRGRISAHELEAFEGHLTIKGLSGNWIECQMTDVHGKGAKFLDELTNKFMVKLDGKKVLEVNSTGTTSAEGNKRKKEMIQQIIMDRSDIVRLIKDGHHDESVRIEMPIGGKCKPELKEEVKKDKKFYQARSTAPNCLIEDEMIASLTGMGFELTADSPTEVTLIYDTTSNKQIGLHLYAAIRTVNRRNSDVILANERVEIEYLGSNDIAP